MSNILSGQPKPRVIILNNEIIPYRIPLFERLAARDNLRPLVLYCGRRAHDRQWNLDNFRLAYPYKILTGFSLKLPKPRYNERRTIWVNPLLGLELVRQRPDVIIGYEYSVPALTAMLYSQLSRCPYLTWSEMTAHADRSLTSDQHWTRRYIIPRSRAFLGTSHGVYQGLNQQGVAPDRFFLAPQPLDVAYFQAQSRLWQSRQAAGPPTVVYVGYLNERKGVTHLIQAFKQVVEQLPQAVLKIAGVGVLEASLRQQVEQLGLQVQVQFLGFIEPVDMPRIYAGADVFVLPSLEDTFGVVATEALASGLSVICSQYAGFSTFLTDGHNGFIIDPQNHDQLAERMLRLLRDATLRACFGQNAQPLLELFSPDYVARQFEAAVSSVLQVSKP